MWTANDIPDQHGRVAVVTGANGGLGFEVARALARKGAAVVMAARDRGKAEAARAALAAEVPGATLELRPLDLGRLESVRACAAGIVADHERIDLLVNNAGLMAIPERRTPEGFEMQLAVNHLGHFVLTCRLLPALLAAPAGRVVTVTSVGRFLGPHVGSSDPHLRRRYGPWRAYGRSKRANLVFAHELHRRLAAAGAPVQSLAADPGFTHTDLQQRSRRESGSPTTRFASLAVRAVGMAPERGALPLLRAATDPAARGGELYGPLLAAFGPPVPLPMLARPGRAGPVLWAVSERETGERFDVAELLDAQS